MLTFTEFPPQYAPLAGPLRCRIAGGAGRTIDLRIRTPEGKVLGAKRFVGVDEAELDIAPVLRRAVRYAPEAGGTRMLAPGSRVVTAQVEAQAEGDDGMLVASAVRTFLPCREEVTAPALLTEMPRVRLIGPAECEELTLVTASAATLVVTAEGEGPTVARSYPVPGAGMHVFRLDMRDFPGAETVTVDAGACGQVVYTVAAPPEGAQRLAWRSASGSVEHYTFPVVRSRTVRVERSRAYGPDGHVVARAEEERQTVLCSACEREQVLEALAGLLAAPAVWTVGSDGYTEADVVSDEAVTVRYGALSALEITVRPLHKIGVAWN